MVIAYNHCKDVDEFYAQSTKKDIEEAIKEDIPVIEYPQEDEVNAEDIPF